MQNLIMKRSFLAVEGLLAHSSSSSSSTAEQQH
jgi:hypothetical protein